MAPGQVIIGAVTSTTVTVAMQLLIAPWLSVTVSVTGVAPNQYGPAGDWFVETMESPLSGSYEPLLIEALATQLESADAVTFVHKATGGLLQAVWRSNAPMSVPSPTFATLGSSMVRAKPRWSVAKARKLVPWSMAGL